MNKQYLDASLSGIDDAYIREAGDPDAIRMAFQPEIRKNPQGESQKESRRETASSGRFRRLLLTAATVAVLAVALLLSTVLLSHRGDTPTEPVDTLPGEEIPTKPFEPDTQPDDPPIIVKPPVRVEIPEGFTAIALTFRSNGNGTSRVLGLEEYFPKEEFIVEDDKKELAVAYTQTELLFPQNRLIYFQYEDDVKVGIDYSDEVINTTEVVIPDGVTEIPDYAFCNFRKLERVTVPDSVTKIGYRAFSDCTALRELDLSDGITEIDRYAFQGCSSLERIHIPSGLKVIPESMLDGCTALTSITVPESVTEIGTRAFAETAITGLVIPVSVQKIGRTIAMGCQNLRALTVPFLGETREQPETLEYLFSTSTWAKQPELETLILTDALGIADYAFRAEAAHSIHTLVLNDGIVYIGKDVYPGVGSALKELKIPDSVTILESFCGYETEKLHLGAGLMAIVPAYEIYPALKELTVSEQNPYFCAVGNVLFSKDGKQLVRYFGNAAGESYTVPSTVTAIADYAFYGVQNLPRVILPDGLERIGAAAFYQCAQLTEINIPESVTVIGKQAFGGYYEHGLTVYCEATEPPQGWDEEWLGFGDAVAAWGQAHA